MKKILMLATGGTIASAEGENGLEPTKSSPEIMKEIKSLASQYEIEYKDILNLDSSNIQCEEWQTIAQSIAENLPFYDGIVVLHGTDTMAYTASIIAFMLRGLKKPVVFTGSQIPMGMAFTDARGNVEAAFAAVENSINGVTIAFNNKIIQGCRAVKVSTMSFDAFESINAPYRGEIFADGLRINRNFTYEPQEPFEFKPNLCNDVFLLKLIPGTNPEIFDKILSMGYKGLVIETFGAGGMHFVRRDLLHSIENLIKNGVAVVICSQCLYEASNCSIYEVGKKLIATGIIEGKDMTTEAIVTKLMWALGQTSDLDEIKKIFATNLAGEVKL
ncbi:MAG: asparaginase [Oscillospiraceae bacterium]